MFQSFTGNSRRPRQVNLGGRNTNPFAAYPPGRHSAPAPGPQNTLAIAQQERLLRQQERERLGATRKIQRTWRGYSSRKITHNTWRTEWDTAERQRTGASLPFEDKAGYREDNFKASMPYGTAAECLSQLRHLVQFLEPWNSKDIIRLVYYSNVFQMTLREVPTIATEGEWMTLLKRLAKLTLRVLRSATSSVVPDFAVAYLVQLLVFLTNLIPRQMARIAQDYYSVMAIITRNMESLSQRCHLSQDTLVQSVLAPLQPITSETLTAYEWFARSYLTIPNLSAYLGTLDLLANNINYKLLISALGPLHSQFQERPHTAVDMDARLWLLAYVIYFHQYALGTQAGHQAPEPEFVKIVSELLNSTAVHLSRRLEADDAVDGDGPEETPLHPFIKEQISSLVNQGRITGLLSQLQSAHLSQGELADSDSDASKEAKILATYALTLLRVFPRRGDDIRMWLYLGSATSGDQGAGHPGPRIPAIKYFWHASRSSRIFSKISQDSTKVLPFLKPAAEAAASGVSMSQVERDEEWTIILLFLELYTFVLKVMDDDEFFSSQSSFTASSNTRVSWTKESALPLKDIKDMTVFLKNLAFTLYWNSADLNEREAPQENAGIQSYFTSVAPSSDPITSVKDLELRNKEKGLPGVTGIPLDYFKGLVTGLLRMIHERDSRRKFLPDGHWLMTNRFDMEGFIPAVVAEEENRHQLQDEDEEEDQTDWMRDDEYEPTSGLIGTGRVQQARRIEALRRRQQQAARRKQLEAVAPRLEILRNMPFFIPFATRVQIFREFIYRDQMRRRQGFIDPDAWRMSVAQASMGRMIDGRPAAQDILSRHHANIRRESVFEDAFEQFYELGEGLKEPIQISFIDKFDTVEAGIDGGGVTKEFLTSVTTEAFKAGSGPKLFEENDQHLLYPNPAAVEQRREALRQLGFVENSPEWNERVRDLLRRYEFLGRIIGKCLYEGILVDVNFAPFFLLKWALTGGVGSAQRETAYRANLNDLKDLDQGLYQGLLQLKNYPGDVEDFALNFTVSDTIPLPDGGSRTVTRDLKSHGSDIAVTNQNRLVYISYIARYRLQVQPALQTHAFLQGLGHIIQPSWLSMFNQAELQTLVSGESGDIDVADLRRNTLYGGVYTIGDDKEEHPTVKLFWEVMEKMSNEERQKVLRFVTSTPRAPLLGFSHLNPRFSIRDSSEDQERLPSTSTCVNLLKLPRYSSAKVLREKLLYAINSGAGFDLS
ncbi:HECT-type E3 ubiquitin-protein ligase [Aspergillus clavatus NRRL 1]|uniref:HECT-type E3 ubiquitin transferase n=1 Tax=Aspergillus clavatus (strain ATCC 1007 / CBS 513.65 / DSM 816 / NCTC 3887 / NRRL 1 / QM 1276 / 107) TaxID=344612 RepID=A1CRM2_ASPCL|nr:IQ and HECT domain protein [Aspergillus clavatus NRRL 1]EAW08293.1 IQ and HECT domain protein [Aspergillus clavatus NRRL 1]